MLVVTVPIHRTTFPRCFGHGFIQIHEFRLRGGLWHCDLFPLWHVCINIRASVRMHPYRLVQITRLCVLCAYATYISFHLLYPFFRLRPRIGALFKIMLLSSVTRFINNSMRFCAASTCLPVIVFSSHSTSRVYHLCPQRVHVCVRVTAMIQRL